MQTNRLVLLWSALMTASGQAHALSTVKSEPSAEVSLAGIAPPGLEITQLNHFFDAAKVRFAPSVLPSAPLPAAAPGQAAQAASSPQAPSAEHPRHRLVVPPPRVTPAYLHTFRTLLAHPEVTDRYDDLILKYAQAYRLEAKLLKAIIAAESEFALDALSPRGARGLMQVMPATAEELGVPRRQLRDPESNIRAGAAYIAVLFKTAFRRYNLRGVSFRDAPMWIKQRVVAAYNAGPRFLFRKHWFRQTRNYVRKVVLFYRSRVTDFRRLPGALSLNSDARTGPSSGILY